MTARRTRRDSGQRPDASEDDATRPAQAVMTVAVSTLVALVGAELALRGFTREEYLVWPPNMEWTFPEVPGVMPGVSGESRFVTNERGIRGRPFSDRDAYRILTIGGSTTECLFLDEPEAWPRLLEADLERRFSGARVWVGSVGKSGHAAGHHALQAEHLPPQYPRIDAAVILVGLNDLLARLRHGDDFRPTAEQSAEREEVLVNHAFASMPPNDADFPWYKRTALWRTLRRIKRPRDVARRGVDQGPGAGYLVRNRLQRQQAGRLIETLPDLESALGDYARTLNRIVTALEEQGVMPVLVTQPTMWRADLPPELERLLWFGENAMDTPGADYFSAGALAEGMRLYNEELLGVCRQRDIACIELATALPKDTTVFYDDAHFNEAGARMVADVLGEALAELPEMRSRLKG